MAIFDDDFEIIANLKTYEVGANQTEDVEANLKRIDSIKKAYFAEKISREEAIRQIESI